VNYKAEIRLFLKPGILDVQGRAVEQALRSSGHSVSAVRVLKVLQMDLEAETPAAAERELLAVVETLKNPVIEEASFTLEPA
jgi:phosphoribosylformylglycinamidine synthase